MITTEIYNGQGLGNQMWAYSITRVIADHNNCKFSILSKHQFKGKDFMDIDFGEELKNYPSHDGPSSDLPDGIEHHYIEKKEVHASLNNNVDISRTDEKIFTIPINTKIDGNLQSTKYIKGRREKILSWFKIKDEYKQYVPDENVCLIHLRCGDYYGQRDVFLPISYYTNAMNIIKNINPNVRFCCVTDQPEIAVNFFGNVQITGSSVNGKKDTNMASHHLGGDLGVDFSYLKNAKYLIIPNSSFSWWAAYLNTSAKIIIAPKYWARFNISNDFWSTGDIITDEFMYIDRQGKMFSPKECWEEKENFVKNNENLHISIRDQHYKNIWRPAL